MSEEVTEDTGAAEGAPGPDQADEAPEGGPESLDEAMAQMMALKQMMGGGETWRPSCVNCLNNHKLAIADVQRKLIAAKVDPASPEFGQALQAAIIAGQQVAQGMAVGMNGQKPDIIPPVRYADVLINGTSCCASCFPAQKQSNLLPATGVLPGR